MAVAKPDEGRASRSESLEELFHALESPLLSCAWRLLHDNDMAQDIVQEAFLRLHRNRDLVREPRNWLYRTVHNLAVNRRRDDRKIVPMGPGSEAEPSGAAEPADPQALPDEVLARWEGIGLVRLGLDGLDPRSREVVLLKFNHDLSYKEIAARTGLSLGHVGYLLHHALKSLAAELARAGLVP